VSPNPDWFPDPARGYFTAVRYWESTKGAKMVGGLVAVLIVIALVLVLLKVAVAGGILGLIAIILLILLLLGRI
jgi:hypothetical protein